MHSRAALGVFASAGCFRNRDFPWGRPDLSLANQRKVNFGNATLLATAQIVSSCVFHGVPVAVENPLTSLAWNAPLMSDLCQLPSCQVATLHQCQYGAPWKKPTRLCCWGAGHFSPQLCKVCKSRNGKCSRSGKFHVKLQGKKPGTQINWTSLAAAYPKQLSRAIAKHLICARRAVADSREIRLLW